MSLDEELKPIKDKLFGLTVIFYPADSPKWWQLRKWRYRREWLKVKKCLKREELDES